MRFLTSGFWWIIFPRVPNSSSNAISIFLESRGDIRNSQLEVHHRQGVWDDLQRTRLTRRRIIGSTTPSALSRRQVVSLYQSSCVLLTDEKGVRVGRGRSQVKRRRENLVFYKSFNTLWPLVSITAWNQKCKQAMSCLNLYRGQLTMQWH